MTTRPSYLVMVRTSRAHKKRSSPGSHQFSPFKVSRLATVLRNKEVSTSHWTQQVQMTKLKDNKRSFRCTMYKNNTCTMNIHDQWEQVNHALQHKLQKLEFNNRHQCLQEAHARRLGFHTYSIIIVRQDPVIRNHVSMMQQERNTTSLNL